MKQVDEELGQFALNKLKEMGVEFVMNTHVVGATPNSVRLDNGITIPCYTLLWSAGVTTSDLIKNLECRHDAEQRIITNDYLEVPEFPGVCTWKLLALPYSNISPLEYGIQTS